MAGWRFNMDPEQLAKTTEALADATKSIADAVALPEETKAALLTPSAKSIGARFGRFFNRHQASNRANEIVEEAWLTDLQIRALDYFASNPGATLDESKAFLIHKQIDDSYYSLDKEDMRDRFAKLIATTADKTRNEDISPIYSQILANLDSESAKLLLSISENSWTPIMETAEPRQIFVQERKSLLSIVNSHGRINQFQSLGLIEVDTLHEYNTDGSYVDDYAHLLNLEPEQYRTGTAIFTQFGNSFIDVIK